MGMFSGLFGKSYTQQEVMQKCMEAVHYYQQRNFKSAAVSFEEYFNMKGKGQFPLLDKEDAKMMVNLGLSRQYSNDINGAIEAFKKIIEIEPNFSDIYMMISICYYKLNNLPQAKQYWSFAQKYGCKHTSEPFELGIIKVNH